LAVGADPAGGIGAAPPELSAAAVDDMASAAQTIAQAMHVLTMVERVRKPNRCNGVKQSLFLMPTELAVGLALKELRYGREARGPVRFAPPSKNFRSIGSPVPGRLSVWTGRLRLG
jgi:hypothetical protein